jgi:invasion protein IalB
VRYFWVLFLGIFALFGAVYASVAAAQEITSEQFKSWTVRCKKVDGGKNACEMAQAIARKDTNKTLAQIAIGRASKTAPWSSVILVPLGVNIPAGVVIAYETGKQDQAKIIRCTSAGCQATWSPSDESIEAMKSGSNSILAYRGEDNRVKKINLSLAGFTAALKKIETKTPD